MAIRAAVGSGRRNDPDDVKLVQEQLARHARWLGGLPVPPATGRWDAQTEAALKSFQKNAGALKTPDGAADPNGFTARLLDRPLIEAPRHRFFLQMRWVHGPALADADFQAAATTLGCEAAAIKAVAKVETKRSPWFEIERPSINGGGGVSHGYPGEMNTAYDALTAPARAR